MDALLFPDAGTPRASILSATQDFLTPELPDTVIVDRQF